jgi:DNA mismatch endonuclease (patch repair protein)
MSRVKSKNTSIEVSMRKALWHGGIRYRKNYPLLPGTPDIAITKYRIAVFCDGEFWHGKDWAVKKTKIHNNREYWIAKIERNMGRDNEVNRRLKSAGWTVLRFWGSDIKKNISGCIEDVEYAIVQFKIDSYDELRGEEECGL